jgi:iron complex outermembrane receptor protein
MRTRCRRAGARFVIGVMVASISSVIAAAQTTGPDLSRISLEDLMNIAITSASRKEQRAADTAAAVYVITRDDIRRSGMTTLPELLRLVPGVQVARINSNSWAISMRGFNDLLADKVMVLVDGRTIYNPLFSGVFWEGEDLMLEDVERIEVIRGPGGAIWGANSTNGVINVITRSSTDTQGTVARAGVGLSGQGEMAIRYGGALGDTTTYRLFSQWSSYGASRTISGAAAGDSWRNVTGGGRIDRSSGADAVMIDGSITIGERHALWLDASRIPAVPFDGLSNAHSGHLISSWSRTTAGGGLFRLQSFADVMRRSEAVGVYDRNTLDADAEYHAPMHGRHDVLVGGGYRAIQEAFGGTVGWTLSNDQQRSHLLNAFVQDEIGLTPSRRVAVSLGAKVERGTLAGTNLQPSARVMWHVVPGTQRLWAATSRGVRTPSALDRHFSVIYPYGTDPSGLPIFAGARGNPDFRDQTVVEHEAGYRLALGSTATFDIAAFTARYDGLRTNEPLPPAFEMTPMPRVVALVEFRNLLRATASGFEATAQWEPLPAWRLEGNYSGFHLTPHLDATSHDPLAAATDGNAPSHQWRLRSALTLGRGVTADATLWHVGALRQHPVPAYTRTDLRIEWPLMAGLSIDAVGQNVFDQQHLEFNMASPTVLATRVARSASVHVRWTVTK